MIGAPLTDWRVEDMTTGEITHVRLSPKVKRGRKPTVKGVYGRVSGMIRHPVPRDSLRFMLGNVETSVLAERAKHVQFPETVERHQDLLRKREHPLAAEHQPPTGQAASWYDDVILCIPRSGREVARQLARLCGDDSRVTVPIRSLTDAMGRKDRAGRDSAYTRRGMECLVESGWLRTKTTGRGQAIVTPFYLMPGDPSTGWFPDDDEVWQDAKL